MARPLSYIGWVIIIAFLFLTCNQPGRSVKSDEAAGTVQMTREAVWYEVLPERFRNGDTANDPVFNDILGAWPFENMLPWQVHPWTSDWYELQAYERENGKDIWFNIARRRYGGDLQGILDKLDYLKELGVGVVQLAPVFMSPSAYKFDATCLHHVDPSFGPDPAADRQMIALETPEDPATWKMTAADSLLVTLIEEIHKRQMKIVLEVSLNHLGTSSFAFQDVLVNQDKSRYKDWFFIRSFEDASRGTLLEYKGWKGIKEFPELRKDEAGMDAGAKKYLFDITRRWMDPAGNGDLSKGIDGWWIDQAYGNGKEFWKEWSGFVRSVNPHAMVIGEMNLPEEDKLTFVKDTELEGLADYQFLFLSSQYFLKGKYIFNTQSFDNALRLQRNALPQATVPSQNALSTLKTDRVGSRSVNRRSFGFLDQERFFTDTRASNHLYKADKPRRKDLDIVKLMVLFQMTYPGIPLVYYGDEAGMWGPGDPANRKPMVWNDIAYDDEAYLANGMRKRMPEKLSVSTDMLEYYKKLIRIRNSSKALQHGDFETVISENDREIYAFSRTYMSEKVYVVLNNSPETQNVGLPVHEDGVFINLLDENREIVTDNHQLSMDIKSNGGAILMKRPSK